MEDQSNTDLILQQQLEEQQQQQQQQQQQLQRQAIHPAPSPVPYPYYPSSTHNQSDRLRRRNTGTSYPLFHTNNSHTTNSEEASQGSLNESQASFFSGLDGLEMPSTSLHANHAHHHQPPHHNNNNMMLPDGNQLLPNSYKATRHHSNSPTNHYSNNSPTNHYYHHPPVSMQQQQQQQQQQQRLNKSLNNISHSPPRHPRQEPPRQPSYQRTATLPAPRSSNNSNSRSYAGDDAHTNSNTNSRRRPFSRDLTPQHQIDRRNSRRRVTSTSSASSSAAKKKASVPNRYYIPGNKSVQTEWSSPTRQRRSRNTLPNTSSVSNNNSMSSNDSDSRGGVLPEEDPNAINNNNNNNSSSSGNQNIIVLPSISIPNGSCPEEYNTNNNNYHRSSQAPTLPLRRPCVTATSMCFRGSGTVKFCVLIQFVFVIPLCLYVFDAHAQQKSAKQQLQQYNEEHEHMLNQMMWMDAAAKKITANQYRRKGDTLHHSRPQAQAQQAQQQQQFYPGDDNFGSTGAAGRDTTTEDNTATNYKNYRDSYYGADTSATEDLRDSVHKLRGQMRDIQYRIQQNSIVRINEKYGEGPIQVYIHPEPQQDEYYNNNNGNGEQQDEMTSEIAIELFIEDTPHAVSTFLYQIERGHWNRVQMNWISETSILSKPGSAVTSGMGDWMQTSRLEFLEQFPIRHCEVALVQRGQMGVLSLKINLVEVPFQEHEEVCIGRLLNDRLILPKSREYFMAEFTTTSNSGSGNKKQHTPPKDEDSDNHPEMRLLKDPLVLLTTNAKSNELSTTTATTSEQEETAPAERDEEEEQDNEEEEPATSSTEDPSREQELDIEEVFDPGQDITDDDRPREQELDNEEFEEPGQEPLQLA
ncbi:expressed unknown protein [Seminavis robusta]|uniref:Uncharacterized protein n=1 Tax=Seminavis robusta TaxID=568900 RepID=A0A9N8EUL0_9STRA|nr:expressed unknown protein [Seminavis robusta]|eukprot:Sro1924_g305730.1 n/a (864) ;mRNA; r:14322-16913